MKNQAAVGIAGAALAVGIAVSAGVSGYMIGHHTAAPAAAEWRIEPSDIAAAVDEYRAQQWETVKKWAAMQPDMSASDDLLTPPRPASTRRDLTQRQRGALDELQDQLDDIQKRIDTLEGHH
jgi:hypothetical protein